MPVPSLPTNNPSGQTTRPEDQPPVQISPKGYKGVTVDTKSIPFDVLTTYLAGQAWNVDYYEAIVGKDDALAFFQPDLPAAWQSYKCYRGLELKSDGDLQSSPVGDTKDMTLTGSSKVYPVLVPKEGDFFIADIGDGREGLFSITSSRRLSHYNSSPHSIDYTLSYLTDAEIKAKIDAKTIETVFFKKDWMRRGLEPLVHEEDTEIINKLTDHNRRLMAVYFNDFYSRTFKSLLVPDQTLVTYDPFLVKFLKTILSTEEHPTIRHIVEFNVSEDQAMYEFTLWNCLANMDFALLPMCVHEAGIADVNEFFSRPLYNSVYYSGVQAVVYPEMGQTNVDAGYDNPMPVELVRVTKGRARFRELDRLIRVNTLNMDPTLNPYEGTGDEDVPAIRRITCDNYYVLSEAFYQQTGDTPLSKLEALTLAALKGDAIDIRELEKLCARANHWDNVERFYYIPILFVLLRVYPRSIK